jgi:hypothetical protein
MINPQWGFNPITKIIRMLFAVTLFQQENLPPISFTDVLFVPGMKKNLISVSTL